MVESTGQVSWLPEGVDFAGLVKKCMTEILGPSAAFAIFYHLGDEAIRDPNVFEEKLRTIFGAGAETLMKHIQNSLETS